MEPTDDETKRMHGLADFARSGLKLPLLLFGLLCCFWGIGEAEREDGACVLDSCIVDEDTKTVKMRDHFFDDIGDRGLICNIWF